MSDCNSVYFIWKFTGNIFVLKMESQIHTHTKIIFFCNLETYFQTFLKTESTDAYFSVFTGLCLANISKCMKLFAITWACHSLSLTWNATMVWNEKQLSWFSSWRHVFNLLKWVAKSKQAKKKPQITNCFILLVNFLKRWKLENLSALHEYCGCFFQREHVNLFNNFTK